MIRLGYRYRFDTATQHKEAQETLLLALLAAEGLFGRSRVRMDANWAADTSINAILIDAGTLVGMTVALIFTAFITAEFGAGSFSVRQVEIATLPAAATA